MPDIVMGEVSIRYEVHGDGPPLLLLAPGGLRLSRIENWVRAPWDPIEALADRYRVVVMDQRNAGRSVAPVSGSDGWAEYSADQLGLMDHLGIDRFGVVGMCIGAGFGLRLAHVAPDRITGVVAMQPIGNADNRDVYRRIFDEWRDERAPAHPEASAADWEGVWRNMFGGDELLWTIPDAAVPSLRPPVLVLLGDDEFHPSSVSRAVAARAPEATLVERWKEPADQPAARRAVDEFLAAIVG